MEKKYETSEVISLLDRGFTNFEKQVSENQAEKDPQFYAMLSLIKLAVISEVMNLLREEK